MLATIAGGVAVPTVTPTVNPGPPATPFARNTSPPPSQSTLLIIGGAALGAAALGFGIGFGVAAQGKGKDATTLLGKIRMSGTPCKSPPQAGMCEDLHSTLQQHDAFHKTFEGLVIVGTVVGAATVAYALWPRAKQDQPASVRVVPLAGPSVGGAFVSGTF